MSPEPDAWKWYNQLTEEVGVLRVQSYEGTKSIREKPLFSAKTVQEEIEKRVEELEDKRDKLKSPQDVSDISERTNELRRLKERFSQSNLNKNGDSSD